jgi:chitinase
MMKIKINKKWVNASAVESGRGKSISSGLLLSGVIFSLVFAAGIAFAQHLGRDFTPRPKPEIKQPESKKVVIGYYPSFKREDQDHNSIDYDSLTHIAEAFVKPDSEGNLVVDQKFIYPELLSAAHRHGVKVLVSIGGWGNCEGFAPMASSPEKRARFISQVIAFCLQNGYDGVDLDWEFVSSDEESQNFSALVRELSQALRAQIPPLLLTMAAPAGPYWGRWINFEQLHPYFDYISFMTYDYHGPWTDHAGHNSPLYTCQNDPCGSVDDTFTYSQIRQVPLQKLLLGIPFYGRSFDTTGLYKPAQNSQYYDYSAVVNLQAAGWKYNWDACSQVPYLISPNGKTYLSFDDRRSVEAKCRYVLQKKAAGVIIWEIKADRVGNRSELLPVVGRTLKIKK